MKKLSFVSLIIMLNINVLIAQFNVGHKQITFIDSARSNRAIQTEIYYPANTAGDNVSIANGQFPFIVFGHGFVMTWSTYQNFWDSLVPQGYIMAFPRTEGTMSPNHTEFGADLRFLNEQLKKENNLTQSFFHQKLTDKSAIMGHSMGGGSSFLACKDYTNVTTMITFAAATTTPSSIDIANLITVPVLMFSGQNDCVTPPVEHQIPMYDSLASQCKTHITIKGASHCYFGNYNFNCSFGESTCSPTPSISRTQQHDATFDILKPYLKHILKNDNNSLNIFLDSLSLSPRITFNRQCTTTNINSLLDSEDFLLFPNPVVDELFLNTSLENYSVSILRISGEIVYTQKENNYNAKINISELKQGIYILEIKNKDRVSYRKVIKQ